MTDFKSQKKSPISLDWFYLDFFLLMLVAAAACFLMSLILFLALLDSSVLLEVPLELLAPLELPDLVLEDPELPVTELPLPESPLEGEGLCLLLELLLLLELPEETELFELLSLSDFLSSFRRLLLLLLLEAGFPPGTLFFVHFTQCQISLGSLAS